MSGDAARSNDDELLSEIDELKARMDRLMRGGSSTSNSALLTDAPKAAASPSVEAQPTPAPPPQRAPVRELIGSDDSSAARIEGHSDAVAFPAESKDGENRPADKPADERPSSAPPSKPKSAAIGGSVISVDDDRGEKRPQVSSFDEMGTAIESELARDASVPPASSRKGPDLASRFGPAGEEEIAEVKTKVAEEMAEDDHEVVVEETPEPAVKAEPQRRSGPTISKRRPVGAVVAIWVFTAVTSGVLATLHFTGVI